ncbi:MAG: helix-turn-helix transcriptional regulator [Litorimonas sp.]
MTGISETQISFYRNNVTNGIKFGNLAKLCGALNCQPGDILAY